MSAISFFEFRNALDRNQEIEFSLFDRQYFATPRTDPPEEQLYAILDVEKNIWIFEGSIECLLTSTMVNHWVIIFLRLLLSTFSDTSYVKD